MKMILKESASGITTHQIFEADARNLVFIPDESVHLVCTSPPYGCVKIYPDHPEQLGNMASYERFLNELDQAWNECFRVLVPGGRVTCVVGDISVSRRQGGRHHVLPLSADLQVRARRLGFECLTPIRWLKGASMTLEALRSARYLGKPNLPNGVVKDDLEHILFFRKPGGYRKLTREVAGRSFISAEDYARWFAPVWSDVTEKLRRDHPAPYPVEIPRRLIRMFSFVGDTVLDPFAGSGTTAIAAIETGRHSINVEIEPRYADLVAERIASFELAATVEMHSPKPVAVRPVQLEMWAPCNGCVRRTTRARIALAIEGSIGRKGAKPRREL